ncbi:probable 28S rRNA (cytosine-C(5))-methyltransferase [Bombyx mandarina]|uniref:Probable 28S rRNA (Cytosine-C(5))-methyltransferase n=1 Tax=Bombyx mandarina TaxID=7092 RepID=A0A6J2JGQ3_BOMMA|nr:probable 28S rRNA (cytosine-C(5))-methyltransferase [Bombyx mandarina]
MFEHSVKVPRHYKVAANILKKVSTEGGSVKTLLYDDKLRHFRTNVLFALITETIKHSDVINKIFESCDILQNEIRLDPWLAKILTAELLYGKKVLPGKSKPEQTISSYKENFEKYLSEHQDDSQIQDVPKPRYVRINTNLLTTSDAIRAFQDEGYHFVRCTSGSYEDYLKQIQNLSEEDFTQDYHVKTIFVFPPGTKLHDHELYFESKIILQNKATAMAVHLLAPPSGSIVLDMCAAPGMKTTQTAAYMRNNGKIYAIERNEKRFETLRDFVNKTGSHCVEPIHRDCLEIKKGEFDDVEYILLDPSCSGSGMDISVHNYIEESRLAKLTSLQEKFLKHAMNAFPRAKRIVYSTCSLFPEENERVITNVVKTSRTKWRVQDVKELLKGQWKNFGSAMYGSMGTRCMYARQDSDLTTGFFLAVLDRDPKDLEKSLKNQEQNGEVVEEEVCEKDKESKADYEQDRDVNELDTQVDSVQKRKRKKERSDETHSTIIDSEGNNLIVDTMSEDNALRVSESETSKKKKKKKKSKDTEYYSIEITTENNIDINEKHNKMLNKNKVYDTVKCENTEKDKLIVDADLEEPVKKKKKKKDKRDETEEYNVENGNAKRQSKKRSNNNDFNEIAEKTENIESDKVPKKKKKNKN